VRVSRIACLVGVPAVYALPPGITGQTPPEVANHIVAVALFGESSSRFLNGINAPPITISPHYASKTIQQCIPDDPVCTMDGSDLAAHGQYVASGTVGQAADFAARRL
jgi:cutinase